MSKGDSIKTSDLAETLGLAEIIELMPYGIPKGKGWDTYELCRRSDFTRQMIDDYLERLDKQKASDRYQLKPIKPEDLVFSSPNFSNELVELRPQGLPDGKGGYLPWTLGIHTSDYKFSPEFVFSRPNGIFGKSWSIWDILRAFRKSSEKDFIQLLGRFEGLDFELSTLSEIMSEITPVEQIATQTKGFFYQGLYRPWYMRVICRRNKTLTESYIEAHEEGLPMFVDRQGEGEYHLEIVPWDLENLLGNDNISIGFIQRNIEGFPGAWWSTSRLSEWSKLTPDFVEANPIGLLYQGFREPWNMKELSERCDITTIDLIRRRPKGFPSWSAMKNGWCYKGLSKNDNITEDFVEEHLEEFKEHWSELIRRPNLSLEFVLKHFDKLDLENTNVIFTLSREEKFTFEFFLEYFTKVPVWNTTCLAYNKSIFPRLTDLISRSRLGQDELRIFSNGNPGLIENLSFQLRIEYGAITDIEVSPHEIAFVLIMTTLRSFDYDKRIPAMYTRNCQAREILDNPNGFEILDDHHEWSVRELSRRSWSDLIKGRNTKRVMKS